ncbi:Uncharacterised protein [Bordetella pertussis]|nr:Uncharacterised protein [Bordetella pertussis]
MQGAGCRARSGSHGMFNRKEIESNYHYQSLRRNGQTSWECKIETK